MSRPSVRTSIYAPSQPVAPSSAAAAAPPPTTGAAARIAAKQAELQGLRALREQSARLARDVEALGDSVDTLVEGGEAVASVLASWQGVFRAIQIARASTAQSLDTAARAMTDASSASALGSSDEAAAAAAAAQRAIPETLVRLPLESINSTAPGRLTE